MTERNEVQRGGPQSGSSVYEYDPNLPYVVAHPDGTVACRTDTLVHAEVFRDRIAARHVIDTTPKPRAPEDAKVPLRTQARIATFEHRKKIREHGAVIVSVPGGRLLLGRWGWRRI